MKYKILIFDADQTLFDFKKSEKEALRKSIEHYKIKYKETYHLHNYSIVNLQIWKELEEGKITQKQLKVERFKRFFDVIKLHINPEEFAQVFMDYLSKESHLYDESIDLIKELSSQYKLIIITNGLTKVQNVRIMKSIIAPYFEHIIVSETVGVSKPNPEIFDIALKGIKKVNKSEILMIGDNLKSDILGGINYGIDTAWCNLFNKENDTEIQPTYEFHSLWELIDIIQ